MKCENCGNEHDGSYGSGRFCSKSCKCAFNAKKRTHFPTKDDLALRSGGWVKKAPFGTWKCCHCGFIAETKSSLCKHKHEVHPHAKGQAWNKGLTKETSEAMRRRAETLNRKIASGEIIPSNKGKHHTEEHRRKISESRKRYLKEHPEKVPYVLNHSSKESFPERFFREAFTNEGFPKFTQDKYVNGYFLDFAFEGLNKYIEVDGEQHYLDKKIVEHDIIRQNNLANTEWQCVCRIRWSKFQKLSNEYKHRFLLGLKAKLIGK